MRTATFAAGLFKGAVKIGGVKIDPSLDARFKVGVS